MTNYELIEKTLFIKDESTGEIVWQGRPYGCSVEKIMPMPGRPGCIVLLDHREFSRSEIRYLGNLINVGPDGKTIWSVPLFRSHDSFVDFDWEGNMLFANTWSCFRVQIDLETGKILSRIFT